MARRTAKITFDETNGDYIVCANGQRVGVVIRIEDKFSFGADDETIDNIKVPMSSLKWQEIIAEWIQPQLEQATVWMEDYDQGTMVVKKHGGQVIGFVYFHHNLKTNTNWWQFRTGDFKPILLTGIIPPRGLQSVVFLERIRRAIESYWLSADIA